MSDSCIFCQIIDGEIPAEIVYEDDGVLSFLDVNPLSRGHTLVIPKAHRRRVADLSPTDRNAVFETIGRLTPVVETAVDADAVTIGMNDGTAAGQEIPHVHGHIVPRFEGDNGGSIHAIMRSGPDISEEELGDIADRIRSAHE
jgi:histidine triad (HIT) family protein